MKNILLVEPNFKTKFPPLGLMKISAYHKALGDRVVFVKGIIKDFPFDEYWDRVYVSTLFTYNWKITVDTILHYKDNIVNGDLNRIFVGGILAGLMSDELWRETGVKPITGVLNYSNAFGDKNNLIIDEMIPDYDLFKESTQKYNLIDDSYFGYTTRGCVWKCDFCGVPKLEPNFIEYKGIIPYVTKIEELYGTKPNLVLFDNNILASKKLEKVINDFIELGFEKGAIFSYKNKVGQTICKQRHVDFNQGTDARLINNKNIRLLSKICINPLRIAFDHISFEKKYVDSVRLAAENGIIHLSNYILYNYNDTPEDFWRRLKINIDLNTKYGLQIYSFPMKYIPLNAKDRSFVSEPNWNWYFLRSVMRILNVLKGSVMTGLDFFNRAFGENVDEFKTILYMPEHMLMFRGDQPKPEEKDWLNKFNKLTKTDKLELLNILNDNRTTSSRNSLKYQTTSLKLKRILEYYEVPKINGSFPLFD